MYTIKAATRSSVKKSRLMPRKFFLYEHSAFYSSPIIRHHVQS